MILPTKTGWVFFLPPPANFFRKTESTRFGTWALDFGY
jgi:hypothetical protein